MDWGLVQKNLLSMQCGIVQFASQEKVLNTIRLLKPYDSGINLIRVGGNGDGGYLIPDDLEGIKYCFSPGVSSVADFELFLANKYGIKSFMIDASVDNSPIENDLFVFEKKFLSSKNDPNCISLDNWVKEKLGDQDDSDLMLQMDIESGEFDVFIDASGSVLDKFRVIVVEFHVLDFITFDLAQFLIESIFRKLTKNHTVVHLHPNNIRRPIDFYGIQIPPIIEVTLLRNDRFKQRVPCETFPHPLDCANVPHLAEVELPDVWYKYS
jgi:hypothetical protein